jgi:uncharacterized protein (TIGR02453 family)
MGAHFTPALFKFLKDLKRHNDREWFAANRNRYAIDVEGPMLAFIGDFGSRLRGISPAYVADRRRMGGSMFRIHRDTRFSADKSPFKTNVAARFPHEARKKVDGVPSFYVSLMPGDCEGGGGVYHTAMPVLTRLRRHIVAEPKRWKAVLDTGLEVQGEQLKRAPAGFDAKHPFVDDLRRKDFYSLMEFTEEDVVASDFLDRFTNCCERVAPLIEFQTKALGLRW